METTPNALLRTAEPKTIDQYSYLSLTIGIGLRFSGRDTT